MAFRGHVDNVQIQGGPPDRYHRLCVFDDGLVIGPPYPALASFISMLVIAAVIVPALVLWFGWVASNPWMMLTAAAGFVVLAGTALLLWWAHRRRIWPGPRPATAGDAAEVQDVRGADLVRASRIVWVELQPRIQVPGPKVPEANESVILHMVDGAAMRLSGPDGLMAAVDAMDGVATTDPDPSTGTHVQVIRPRSR